MNYFTTRVELHDAVYSDYETLHAQMAKLNFQKTIRDTKTGITYHLPTAEYRSYGEITLQEVLNLAKAAVAKTSKTASIIVTQSLGVMFSNLTPVRRLV